MPRQRHGFVDSLNLVVSLCLVYTICIACVRIWIRRGSYGTDDLVIAIGTLVTLCNSGTSYAALANGLGKKWEDLQGQDDLASLSGVHIGS